MFKIRMILFLLLLSLLFSLFSSPVYAQSTVSIPNPTDDPSVSSQDKPAIVIDPILQYLEGYAYDSKGAIIPNAKVMVKLEMSKAVFYETKTDEKGVFRV